MARVLQAWPSVVTDGDGTSLNDLTGPALAADFAICVRPAGGGRQSWELLDDGGEPVMRGEAADQTAAIAMARFAVSAVQALRRVQRVY
jgi:hypothetical protein